MEITASAPGKLMLFGEHAVVYNWPCIVTAVDLRVHVTVAEAEDDQVAIQPSAGEPYRIALAALETVESYPRDVALSLIHI